MVDLTFEWDLEKAADNLKKHGVSFEEAESVFLDPLAMVHPDPDHSTDESRAIIIGQSSRGHLLLVSFTDRGSTIRIISARSTTRRERLDYEETK
jgi:uncharacterized DUF497 family protein